MNKKSLFMKDMFNAIRTTRTLLLAVSMLVLNQPAFACKLKPTSVWNYDIFKLANNTQLIFEGRLIGKEKLGSLGDGQTKFQFLIKRTLKGKAAGQTLTLMIAEALELSPHATSNVELRGDCSMGVSLEVDKDYLIFVNSFNPNGYQQIDEKNTNIVTSLNLYLKGKKNIPTVKK
jgi:hypothetical protein